MTEAWRKAPVVSPPPSEPAWKSAPPVGQAPHTAMGRDVAVGDNPLPGEAEAGAVLRGMTNPVGISDELGGVGQGVVDWAKGGSFTSGYNRFVDKARAIDAGMDPTYMAVGQTAASLPLFAAAPALNLLKVGPAAADASLVARTGNAVLRAGANVANAGISGGVYGEALGAANETGTLPERAIKALPGAGITAAIGAAIPIVGAAARGVGKVAGSPLKSIHNWWNPEMAAATDVADAAIRDKGSVAAATKWLEAGRKTGAPVMPLDLGENARTLGRAAADISPEAVATLNAPLDARLTTQIHRIRAVFDRFAPGFDSLAEQDALKVAARAANAPLYKAAYAAGDRPLWGPKLEQLAGTPMVKDAMKAAAERGQNVAVAEGMGAFNPGVKITPDGQLLFTKGPSGVPTYPNLQYWDYAKRELDTAVKKMKPGTDEYRVGTQLLRQLREELGKQVPEYNAARSSAAEFFGADNALDAGEKFARQTGLDAARTAGKYVKQFSDPEKRLFGIGYVTKTMADLKEVPDRLSIVRRIFDSPAERERLTLALGKDAAKEMEATYRLEVIMDQGKNALQGNSKTARYLLQTGATGMGVGVGAGIMTGQVNPYDPMTYINPSTMIYAVISMGMIKGGSAATKGIRVEVAKKVATMLASDDPQIIQNAVKMIGGSPTLLSALRRGQDRWMRMAAPQVLAFLRLHGRGVAPDMVADQSRDTVPAAR